MGVGGGSGGEEGGGGRQAQQDAPCFTSLWYKHRCYNTRLLNKYIKERQISSGRRARNCRNLREGGCGRERQGRDKTLCGGEWQVPN